MPHIIVEHSPNIPASLNVPTLLKELHETLAAQETFTIEAIKTRNVSPTHFVVADKGGNLPYVHITLALLEGRSETVLKTAGEKLFSILEAHTVRQCKTSMEIREMDAGLYWK